MPIHDWTRVHDCLFHDFHLSWVVELSKRMNNGVLPSSHFALNETLELRPPVGFIELPEPDRATRARRLREGRSASESPPRTRITARRNRIEYASRILTIREVDTQAVVAATFIVSQQDKQIGYRWESFIRHAVAALSHGIHLLILDLFPPGKRDPHGIHKAIWDQFADEDLELPTNKRLTLASYDAGTDYVAYVEFVGVGDELPDMPLFLEPDSYITMPLEATYQAAWSVFPSPLKGLLETPGTATGK